MKEREKLGSRLGFILISAGCAIGIGNVWKFPYMAGQGGGGAFVLFYLIFLLMLGLPIMTMEFAVGRASQKSPVKSLLRFGKTRTEMAYPRLHHINRMLSVNDVLHNRCRMDASLLLSDRNWKVYRTRFRDSIRTV